MVEIEGEERVGSGRRRRRLWSEEEKRRIVAETLKPGASVSVIARRHDVNANMLFTWRRTLGATSSGVSESATTLVPAAICTEPAPALSRVSPAPAGRMEIVFAGGERVLVGADVDAAALARVVKVLCKR